MQTLHTIKWRVLSELFQQSPYEENCKKYIADENKSHFCFTSNDISLLTESWLKHLFQIKPPSAEDSNLKLKWQHPMWHYSLPLMKGDSRTPDTRALQYHRCRKMSLSPTEKGKVKLHFNKRITWEGKSFHINHR